MNRFLIQKEGDIYVPYKKRKLIGWKRLATTGFPTIYVAIKFLSDNYGAPIFNETNNIEIRS